MSTATATSAGTAMLIMVGGSGWSRGCRRPSTPTAARSSASWTAATPPLSEAGWPPTARRGGTGSRLWRSTRRRRSAKAIVDAQPNAQVSVDGFHLVQLANLMVPRVRQRLVRDREQRRGRKVDPGVGEPDAAAPRLRRLVRPSQGPPGLGDHRRRPTQELAAAAWGSRSSCVGPRTPASSRSSGPAGDTEIRLTTKPISCSPAPPHARREHLDQTGDHAQLRIAALCR
jgi:hypothetical protein